MKDHKQPTSPKEPQAGLKEPKTKEAPVTSTQEKRHSFPKNWPKKKS